MASPIAEFLKTQVSITSKLTDEELAYIVSKLEYKTVKAGGIVLFKGEAVEGLHVVQQGSVEIWTKPPKAHETLKVAELGVGSFFGEASILSESLAGATVKGGPKGATLLIIPQETFLQLIQARPEIKDEITAVIASRQAATAPAPKPQ